MSGALGTVVLAGVTSGVLSISGVVGVASISGVVVVSVSFSGVVTTASVGRNGVLTLVSTSFSGVGVVIIVVGVSEMVVSIVIGVGAGVSISVSVSFPDAGVGIVVLSKVTEKVLIELSSIVKVFVIGMVFGVLLIVTTVLVTRKSKELGSQSS